jgi:ribonuclease HI
MLYMASLRLYTDGSCYPSGTVGGWAWILVDDDVVDSDSGTTPAPSTHQKCELTAAIEGLAHVTAVGVREVTLLSDSKYLVEGAISKERTGWAHVASKREWRTTRGKPVLNRALWEQLLELDSQLDVTWRHVPGHRPKWDMSDDARYNREVDALAGEARRPRQPGAPT